MGFDSKKLELFTENIKRAESQIEEFDRYYLDKKGTRIISLTKSRTPVDTGRLKASWFKTNAITKGNTTELKIYNHTPYASFVEYGHQSYAGRFMLHRSIDSVLSRAIQKDYNDEFIKWMKGKGVQ